MKAKKSLFRASAQNQQENYPSSAHHTTLSWQKNVDPQQFRKIIRMNSENYSTFSNEITVLGQKNSNFVWSGFQEKLKLEVEPKVQLSKKKKNQTGQQKFDQDLLGISSDMNYSEFFKKKPRFSRSSATSRGNASKVISSEIHNQTQKIQENQKSSEETKVKQLLKDINDLRIELQKKTNIIDGLSNKLQKLENKLSMVQQGKVKDLTEKENKIIDLQFRLRVQRERSMQISRNFYTVEDMLTKYKEENFTLTINSNKLVVERDKLKKRVKMMEKMLAEQVKKRNMVSNRSLSIRNKTSVEEGSSLLQKTERVSRFSMKQTKSSKQRQQDLQFRILSPLNGKSISRISGSLLELSPD